MGLVNMALPKPKKSDKKDGCASGLSVCDEGKEPKYPWGLTVRLDTDAMAKLGLKIKDFDTDTIVRIEARAETTRVSEDDTRSGGKAQELTLQITDLGITREGEDGFEKGWAAAGNAPDKAKAKDGGNAKG